jgi:hypothetical protein
MNGSARLVPAAHVLVPERGFGEAKLTITTLKPLSRESDTTELYWSTTTVVDGYTIEILNPKTKNIPPTMLWHHSVALCTDLLTRCQNHQNLMLEVSQKNQPITAAVHPEVLISNREEDVYWMRERSRSTTSNIQSRHQGYWRGSCIAEDILNQGIHTWRGSRSSCPRHGDFESAVHLEAYFAKENLRRVHLPFTALAVPLTDPAPKDRL